MNSHDSKKKRPLKRHFVVNLNEKEAANLKAYTTEKVGYDYLRGTPRLIRKRNGKYVAKIFRRFGIDQGSTTAIGKIKFTDDRELAVTIKSGGLGIGYFFLCGLILSTAYEIWSILQPAMVEELELTVDHCAFVFVICVFGFMSWVFLSRYIREPDLDNMEGYLKGKIGGEWEEE
jgi:hypothetical protein